MANVNRVFLIGNLTREPELRHLPNGTPLCEFGMAINRKWKGKDGQDQDETCFVECQIWARRGEVLAQYFHKGDPIYIEGRLKYDAWENKEGQKRSKLCVVAENFEFLNSGGGRKNAAPRAPQAPAESPAGGEYAPDTDLPF